MLTAIAILAALLMARIIARRLALDPEKVWDLGLVGVITALIAPRLVLIAGNWADFRAHPLWMLGLVAVRSPTAVLLGVAVAIATACTFLFFVGLPFRRTLDALAAPIALGYAIASIGAFAAGSEFGTPANLPWAVIYTSRLASIWNHTPLGTPVHPTQIYAAIVELAVFFLLIAAIATPLSKKLRDGGIMGAWLFLHGFSSFFLNFLRGDLTSTGFLLTEIVAAAMVVAGGLLWLL